MITDLALPARLEPATLAALDPTPDHDGPRLDITWQPDDRRDLPGRLGLAALAGQTLVLEVQGTPVACRIITARVLGDDALALTVELVGRFRVLDQPGATSPSDPATGHTIPAPLAQPFIRRHPASCDDPEGHREDLDHICHPGRTYRGDR